MVLMLERPCFLPEEEECVPCPLKPELASWVKSSAPVTGAVLAEGTRKTGSLVGEFYLIKYCVSDARGEGP